MTGLIEGIMIKAGITIAKTFVEGVTYAGVAAGGIYCTKRALAQNAFEKTFDQPEKDRYMHMQVVGKSGSGKTSLLKRLVRKDLLKGNNVVWIEIKEQDEAHQILGLVPEEHRHRVIYFSPYENNVGFNVLAIRNYQDEDEFELVVDTIVNAFAEAYSDSWGAQTEMCLEMATRSILHRSCQQKTPYTLDEVYKILSNPDYMEEIYDHLQGDKRVHQSVLDFLNPKIGFAKVPIQSQNSVRTKLRRFLTHPRVRRAICKTKANIDFDKIVRNGILVCDFHKGGSLGKTYSRILASFVASNLQIATFRKSKKACRPTFFYYDEFQDYVTPNFEEALSQFRSFQTGVILSHQYLTQLTPSVRDAIEGCVSSFVHLRAGEKDYKTAASRMEMENEEYMKNMAVLTACARLTKKGKLQKVKVVRIRFVKVDWAQSKRIRKYFEERDLHEQPRHDHPPVDSPLEMGDGSTDGNPALPRDEISQENRPIQLKEIRRQPSRPEPVLRSEDHDLPEVLHLD